MPNELTTERLRELLAICEKAERGPWIVEAGSFFDPATCAALVRRLIALEHGEYICSRCHLRKDAEKDFTELPF